MNNALIQTKDQSAVRGLNFSTVGTAPCTCWRGHSRILLVCSTCRSWLNLAARFLAGGAQRGN